jgi:hypothetical protein
VGSVSAQLFALAPWAVVAIVALVLLYKLAVVILVRSSKTDLYVRDRWTGLWVQRGAENQNERPPQRVLRGLEQRDGQASTASMTSSETSKLA